MKHILPLLGTILLLFIFKLLYLTIRTSDTNIYFYTAYEILNGKFLYTDIFFTNFPLFPYISAFYLFISRNNILFYYFTPTIEISIISLCIYYLIYTETKSVSKALLSSLLYLLSFIVLATSDNQTGVFLASLFGVIAYFFLQKKHFFFMGIFLGCMLLIKAYFLPIALSFFVFLLLKKEYRKLFLGSTGFLLAIGVILLPFSLFSFSAMYSNIIGYSLSRSAGILKMDLFWFFVTKDFFFFVLLIFNLCNYKKSLFFSLISGFFIVFFILYQDIYYLYLNLLPAFLCLSLPNFIDYIQKNFHPQRFVLPTVVGIFLCYTVLTYLFFYQTLGSSPEIQKLVTIIEKENPSVLYGVNDITPALSFLTKTPLLGAIVDTNPNIFRKGLLRADTLTEQAIKEKAVIITHGVSYPEYNITELITDEIFVKKEIIAHCRLLFSQVVSSEGSTNRINVFSCK